MRGIVASIVLAILLVSCNRSTHKVERGFYYWRTIFRLSPEEREDLQKLKVTKLYMRFLDVVYDKVLHNSQPQAPLFIVDSIPANMEIVPVVFITNDVFSNSDSLRLPEMAHYILSDVQGIAGKYKSSIKELQIDCDWSGTTKEKYFSLLMVLKDSAHAMHWALSATIRMFQVKYTTIAGVPPVDRGTLMAYNMSNLRDPAVKNSIIDVGDEKKYLSALDKYPLKLDVVLPLFYWGVLFRDNSFTGLLNNLAENELKDNPAFQKESENNYTVRYDVNLNNYPLLKGDRIRLECCSDDDMQKSIKMIASKNKTDTLCLSFFSLDSQLINQRGNEKISDFYTDYR